MRLVLIDTSGIQKYIFGSNRLRENVGASYLVAVATREWVFEELPAKSNMLHQDGRWSFGNGKGIENDNQLKAEVIYAGGGNAVILFRSEEDANGFIRSYSMRILCDAPGLAINITTQDVRWETDNHGLFEAVQAGLKELSSDKGKRTPSQPLLGLGVTRTCQSTGLPAVHWVKFNLQSENNYDVSQEVLRKHEVRELSNNRLHALIPTESGFAYPNELDDLGRSTGESSYIAVVHIDGNGMGKRIRNIGKGCTNREYITAIRTFSEAMNEASVLALKGTVAALTRRIDSKNGLIVDCEFPDAPGRQIRLKSDANNNLFLPLRPVIFGGDDVAFVCDGRIAIWLALEYIRQFEVTTAQLPDKGGKACCCAGVAIVKSHYPFARAYELSEQLCGSAKHYVRSSSIAASAIDWHFANAGLAGDLDEIRGRELLTATGELNLRPVFVSGDQSVVRSWQTLQKGIEEFRSNAWSSRRNKFKALRDQLRLGPDATKQFCEKFSLQLPDLKLEIENTTYRKDGWLQTADAIKRCAYFDMIELADFNIPLSVVEPRNSADAEAQQIGAQE